MLQEVQIIKKANDGDFFGKIAISVWESKSLNKDLNSVFGKKIVLKHDLQNILK